MNEPQTTTNTDGTMQSFWSYRLTITCGLIAILGYRSITLASVMLIVMAVALIVLWGLGGLPGGFKSQRVMRFGIVILCALAGIATKWDVMKTEQRNNAGAVMRLEDDVMARFRAVTGGQVGKPADTRPWTVRALETRLRNLRAMNSTSEAKKQRIDLVVAGVAVDMTPVGHLNEVVWRAATEDPAEIIAYVHTGLWKHDVTSVPTRTNVTLGNMTPEERDRLLWWVIYYADENPRMEAFVGGAIVSVLQLGWQGLVPLPSVAHPAIREFVASRKGANQ